MLGNCSDYGGNRSLQYIQTKTQSPVFSSPTPLVGFLQHRSQPASALLWSHSFTISTCAATSLCAATLFFAHHHHFYCVTSFFPRSCFRLDTTTCPLPVSSGNRYPSFHPLASLLWSLGCSPPSQPTFSRARLVFPAPKKLSTQPQFWALTTHLWILGMPMMC